MEEPATLSPMPPTPVCGGGRRPRHGFGCQVRRLILALVVVGLVAACSGQPSASFNPNGPCVADGKIRGAYPELETRVPTALGGKPPVSLDSGRNCTAGNLGSLATHGVSELRFAGGVWADSGRSGITIAVFQAPGLQADWMGEWYEATARAARQTGQIKLSKPVVAGRQAHRMDLVNGESTQTVIVWPAAAVSAHGSAFGIVINVVIAADEPESRIQEAVAALP